MLKIRGEPDELQEGHPRTSAMPADSPAASRPAPSPDETHELRRAETMYRLALETSPVPIALTRLSDSALVFANPAVADTFNGGVAPSGPATDWYESPGDRVAMLAKLRADGVLRNYPIRMRRSGGEVGDFLVNMRPVVVEGAAMLCTFVLDVTERMRAEAELRRRTEDMAMILENVSEGLLMVSRDGRIEAGRSAVVERWLGRIETGEPLWDAIGRVDEAAGAWLELGWSAVVEDALPLSVTLDQLPRVLRLHDKTLSLTVSPVGSTKDGELPNRFLLVLRDITEQLERERTEATDRDVLALLDGLVRDRGSVLDFLNEGDALVRNIQRAPSDPILARDVHTLKGTAALMRVLSVAAACELAEQDAASTGEWRAEPRAQIADRWAAVSERIRGFVSFGPETRLDAGLDELETLEGALLAGASANEVVAQVREWAEPRLQARLERFAQQARSLARRLGKPEVVVRAEAHGLRLAASRYAAVWASFAHIVRNAVDHGVQSGEARRAAGRRGPPRIGIGATIEGEWLVVWVEDDGPGIDWSALTDRARRLGLALEPDAPRSELLFADGVSSREVVSETSGRGVGMGAWRDAVQAAGGVVEVTSSAEGTRVACRLPWRSSARVKDAA